MQSCRARISWTGDFSVYAYASDGFYWQFSLCSPGSVHLVDLRALPLSQAASCFGCIKLGLEV